MTSPSPGKKNSWK
jgi:hypothetical protein